MRFLDRRSDFGHPARHKRILENKETVCVCFYQDNSSLQVFEKHFVGVALGKID